MIEPRSSGARTRLRLHAGLLLWLVSAMCFGVSRPLEAQVQVSAISDTVFYANGSTATGKVLVSWPSFTTAAGRAVPAGSTAVTLGAGGQLSVSLAPNAGATPAGTYYTAVYHLADGSTTREYWTVPASAGYLALSAVRTSALPASVAIQAASKQYVDQAIARAALGALPQDATPYVLKTGDTMTGALQLPGDPVSSLQAATKNYVDSASASLQAGLGQKVSTLPSSTQTVVQPAGTQLQVNNLNGQLYAKQYVSQQGNDGINRALASSDCSAGCSVVADPTYSGTDRFSMQAGRTQLTDQRGGAVDEYFLNPQSPNQQAQSSRSITNYETLSAAANAGGGRSTLQVSGLQIQQNALAGGNNIYALGSNTIPYFKSTYSATQTEGYNTTQGQHVLDSHVQNCYGVGDCLMGSQFLYSSGGFRDNSDEGTHPYDIQVAEHSSVFRGTCTAGCTTGSTQLTVTATNDPGTQGEGRFLIDKAASKVITAGSLTGGSNTGPHGLATFTGTSFPVSTLFRLAATAQPQPADIAPGTVNAAIVTSGLPAGYSTNTAVVPAASGVACIADVSAGADNFEMANYTIPDGTHITLNLSKPHLGGATIALGGLCGYGVEQTVDEYGAVRQVFPVIGSNSATSLYYSGLATRILGVTGATGGYANLQVNLSTLQRSGNVVTVTTSGSFAQDVNGLALTIAGVADASYNGTFTVTSTAANQFTYTQSGANSTSSGGTASFVTGSYVLYPMAEVVSVYNTATHAVDGALTLGPNTVAWAAGDPVEMPHFFQNRVAPDTTVVTQFVPRATYQLSGGVDYVGLTSAGTQGWRVSNQTPANQYFGNGGTHVVPQAGMVVAGPWLSSLALQAGESNGISVSCNSHGCGRWNSAYNLFALQSNAYYDYVNYSPLTSTMTFNMNGSQYSLSPTSLTAGTINVTTLNASRINGLQAATSSSVGGVTLGPAASSAVLANVASSGSAADVAGLAKSATVDTTNAANITTGTLDPARLPPGMGGGTCASTVAFSATPVFAVTCANAVFHMPLTGSVTSQSFTGLAAGQRITLIFQVGSTPGYTVQWSSAVHGGFLTSSNSASAGYTQAGRYLVQQLVVDTDGATLLNPGLINE